MSEEKRTTSVEVNLNLDTGKITQGANKVVSEMDKAKASISDLTNEAIKGAERIGTALNRAGETLGTGVKKGRKAWAESMEEALAKLSPLERATQQLERQLASLAGIMKSDTSASMEQLGKAVGYLQDKFAKLHYVNNITAEGLVKHTGSMKEFIAEAKAMTDAQSATINVVDKTSTAYVNATNRLKEFVTESAKASRAAVTAQTGTVGEQLAMANGRLSKGQLDMAAAGIAEMNTLESSAGRVVKRYDEIGAKLRELAADEARLTKMGAFGILSPEETKSALAGVSAEMDKLIAKSDQPGTKLTAGYLKATKELQNLVREMEVAEYRARTGGSSAILDRLRSSGSGLSASQLRDAQNGVNDIQNAQKLVDAYDKLGAKLRQLREDELKIRDMMSKGLINDGGAKAALANIEAQRLALRGLGQQHTETANAAKSHYMQQQVLQSAFVNTFQSIAAGQPIMYTLFLQSTQTIGAFDKLSMSTLAMGTGLLIAGASIAAFAGATAKIGDQANLARGRIKALIDTSAGAEEVFKGLQELSLKTGVSASESATVFARFNEGAKQVGATRSETLRLVETVQKLGIVSGATAQETVSGMRQLGQALGSGRLQGDEMRSVLENIPQVGRAIAESMGVSVDQLRKLGSEGKVTSDKVFQALLAYSAEADRRFAAMPLTMERAWEILGRSTDKFFTKVDDATGVSTKFASVLKGAAGTLNTIGDKMFPDAIAKLEELQKKQKQVLQEANNNTSQGGSSAVPVSVFDRINNDSRLRRGPTPTATRVGPGGISGEEWDARRNKSLQEEVTAQHNTALAILRKVDAMKVEEAQTVKLGVLNQKAADIQAIATERMKDQDKEAKNLVAQIEMVSSFVKVAGNNQEFFGTKVDGARVLLTQLNQELYNSSAAYKAFLKGMQDAAKADLSMDELKKRLDAVNKGKDATEAFDRDAQAKAYASKIYDQYRNSGMNELEKLEMKNEAYRLKLQELTKEAENNKNAHSKVNTELNKLSAATDKANDAVARFAKDTMSEAAKVEEKYKEQIREINQAMDRSTLSAEQKAEALKALKKLQEDMAPAMDRAAKAAEREADAYLKSMEVRVAKAGGKNTDNMELQLRREVDLTNNAAEARKRAIAEYGNNSDKVDEYVNKVKLLTEQEYKAAQEQLRIKQELEGPMGKAFKQFANGIDDDFEKAFAKGFDKGQNLFDSLMDGMRSSFKRLLADLIFNAAIRPIIVPVVQSIGQNLFGLSSAATNGAMGIMTPQQAGGASFTDQAGGMVMNYAGSQGMSWIGDQLGLSSSNFSLQGGANYLASAAGYGGGYWASALPANSGTLMYSASTTPAMGGVAVASENAAHGVAFAGNTAGANAAYTGAASGVSGASGGAMLMGGASVAAAGYGAGSLVGGYLGTKSNSYGVGIASGAASGAAAGAAMGSVIPVIGTAIGAVIGAIAGAIGGRLGTQKLKTPYGGAWMETDETGAIFNRGQGSENGVKSEDLVKQSDAINTALTTMAQLSGVKYGKIAFATEFSGGPKGKGPITHMGGWDGEVVSTSDSPAKVALDIMRYLRDNSRLTGMDGIAGKALNKALATSDGTNIEEVFKALGIAKAVEDGSSALKEFDKSLNGVRVRAKDAMTEGLKPMIEELDLATKYDFGSDYKSLVSDQLKSWLEDVASPQTWTATEQAVAQLTGQLEAMREAVIKVNPDLATTIDSVKSAALLRMRTDVYTGIDKQVFEAQGRGYINQVDEAVKARDVNARDLAAVGGDIGRADFLLDAQFRSIFKNLDNAQLDDVANKYGGAIAQLAQAMKTATNDTKKAEEILSKRTELENRILELQGNFIELRNRERAALDESLRPLQDMIYTLEDAKTIRDATTSDVDAARNSYVDALSKEKDLLTQTRDKFKGLADQLKQFQGSLLTDTTYSPLSPEDRLAEAKKQFDDIAQKALGGDADAMGQLQGASNTYLGALKGFYASSEGYANGFKYVQEILTKAQESANKQASDNDKLLEANAKQLTALGVIDNSITTLAQAQALVATEQEKYNRIVAAALKLGVNPNKDTTSNLDFLTQLYQGVLGREGDAQGLSYWMQMLNSGAVTRDQVAGAFQGSQEAANTNSYRAFINQAYQSVLGHAPDNVGADYWLRMLTSGRLTQDQVFDAIKDSPEAHNLPGISSSNLDLGSALGSVIGNSVQAGIGNAGGALLAEVQGLRADVAQLTQVTAQGAMGTTNAVQEGNTLTAQQVSATRRQAAQ